MEKLQSNQDGECFEGGDDQCGLVTLANTHGHSSRVIPKLYQRERETSM